MPWFPAALEGLTLERNHSLTLPARVLLSRWAAVDGEAAVNWAWLQFRSSGRWDRAFGEIAGSWAWHRPHDLAEWVRQQARKGRPTLEGSSLVESEASADPILSSDNYSRISFALIEGEPRLAYEILLLRGGFSTEDAKLNKSLESTSQIREALLAFACLDEMEPFKSSGWDQIFANGLLHRWKGLDPEDFAASPHARLFPDQPRPADSSNLDPAVRQHIEWAVEFKTWSESESAARPDMSGWSAAKREAWEDFEALLPER